MFSEIALPWLRRRSKGSPERTEILNEAESQYLAKQAKLETAVDGVFVNSLNEMDKDERARVDEYTRATVKGLQPQTRKGKRKMAGDFIVCDDYRRGTGLIPTLMMGGITTLALLLGGYALYATGKSESPQPSPDTDTQYEVGFEVD